MAASMLTLELPPLVDALALLLLAQDADPERFVPAGAVRVHARLCSEAKQHRLDVAVRTTAGWLPRVPVAWGWCGVSVVGVRGTADGRSCFC
jgi:hypothetical protein